MNIKDLILTAEDGKQYIDIGNFIKTVRDENEQEAAQVADSMLSAEDPKSELTTLCTNIYSVMDLTGALCACVINGDATPDNYELLRCLAAMVADIVGYEDIAAQYDPTYTEDFGIAKTLEPDENNNDNEYDTKEIA